MLSKLGLSPSEIKIYLHLLRTGPSYANKISSETQINRTNVYEALQRLISKGLISFITKNKVKWFEAKPYNALLALINQKQEQLITIKENIIKDFKNITPTNNSLEANVFVGKKGLRLLFEEI